MASEMVGDPHLPPLMISTLASVLERLVTRNDAARQAAAFGTMRASVFTGLSKPFISLRCYLERVYRYVGCSPTCYVVAFIYLDRFAGRHPSIPIDSFSVHRFLIASVLTAVKFMDDIFYNNAYFAKVGGISLMEMNFLELDFLFGVNFDLNVTPIIFTTYCSMLQREMHLESPPLPPRLHCFQTEEDSSSCQHKQLTA